MRNLSVIEIAYAIFKFLLQPFKGLVSLCRNEDAFKGCIVMGGENDLLLTLQNGRLAFKKGIRYAP